MKTTIKDVARLAGVSTATVSLVMNNKLNISEKTKKKVLNAVRQLQYEPNVMARNLVKQKTNTILLCAFIGQQGEDSLFYPWLLYSMLNAFSKHDFFLQVVVKGDLMNPNSISVREELNKIARKKLFDGILVLSHWPLHYSEVSDLVNDNFPFVVVGQKIDSEKVSYIDIDHYEGALKAMQYIFNKGRKKVAHIRGPLGQKEAEERFRAYIDSCINEKIEINKKFIVTGNYRWWTGYQGAQKIFQHKEKPDALFASNDEMALGALSFFKENNVRIPEDVLVVGFDGIAAIQYSNPPLPSVRQPLDKLAEMAANALFMKVHNNAIIQETIQCELVENWQCEFNKLKNLTF